MKWSCGCEFSIYGNQFYSMHSQGDQFGNFMAWCHKHKSSTTPLVSSFELSNESMGRNFRIVMGAHWAELPELVTRVQR